MLSRLSRAEVSHLAPFCSRAYAAGVQLPIPTNIPMNNVSKKSPLMDWKKFEYELWLKYCQISPQAPKIRALFEEHGETVMNDHISFRTINHPKFDLSVFADNLDRHFDYKPKGFYSIPNRNLNAMHFEHASKSPQFPFIFVSEYDCNQLSHSNQDLIGQLMETAHPNYAPQIDHDFLISGHLWHRLSVDEYERLANDSEFVAWVAAFGILPNHFALSVHSLRNFICVPDINEFLEHNGYELNHQGGKVKGSEESGLIQSRTVAPMVEMRFKRGIRKSIHGAHYQFAQRFQVDTSMFRGFLPSNMDTLVMESNQ